MCAQQAHALCGTRMRNSIVGMDSRGLMLVFVLVVSMVGLSEGWLRPSRRLSGFGGVRALCVLMDKGGNENGPGAGMVDAASRSRGETSLRNLKKAPGQDLPEIMKSWNEMQGLSERSLLDSSGSITEKSEEALKLA